MLSPRGGWGWAPSWAALKVFFAMTCSQVQGELSKVLQQSFVSFLERTPGVGNNKTLFCLTYFLPPSQTTFFPISLHSLIEIVQIKLKERAGEAKKRLCSTLASFLGCWWLQKSPIKEGNWDWPTPCKMWDKVWYLCRTRKKQNLLRKFLSWLLVWMFVQTNLGCVIKIHSLSFACTKMHHRR